MEGTGQTDNSVVHLQANEFKKDDSVAKNTCSRNGIPLLHLLKLQTMHAVSEGIFTKNAPPWQVFTQE